MIAKKIGEGAYHSAKEFHHDLQLVWANAQAYNREGRGGGVTIRDTCDSRAIFCNVTTHDKECDNDETVTKSVTTHDKV